MSRIGKKPIEIPANVEINLDGSEIKVKGPKGELVFSLPFEVEVKIGEKELVVEKKNNSKQARSLWGTVRALIQNMIDGVTKGYEKVLELHGVGYKMNLQGKKIVMHLGFSHPVEKEIPDDLQVEIEGEKLKVSGIDKQRVGQFAAEIRALKKVEPYKGKGFRYQGEQFVKKEGKKAVGSE